MKAKNQRISNLICYYSGYFKLPINERINSRQNRNGLNINYLFSTVIRSFHLGSNISSYPRINTGLYHPVGKKHSQYPCK